jgi:hypothetical protein
MEQRRKASTFLHAVAPSRALLSACGARGGPAYTPVHDVHEWLEAARRKRDGGDAAAREPVCPAPAPARERARRHSTAAAAAAPTAGRARHGCTRTSAQRRRGGELRPSRAALALAQHTPSLLFSPRHRRASRRRRAVCLLLGAACCPAARDAARRACRGRSARRTRAAGGGCAATQRRRRTDQPAPQRRRLCWAHDTPSRRALATRRTGAAHARVRVRARAAASPRVLRLRVRPRCRAFSFTQGSFSRVRGGG